MRPSHDQECQRRGTLSLLAGTGLLTGKRSSEFIGFLEQPDDAYSADTAIKLILDNHSAHDSRQ